VRRRGCYGEAELTVWFPHTKRMRFELFPDMRSLTLLSATWTRPSTSRTPTTSCLRWCGGGCRCAPFAGCRAQRSGCAVSASWSACSPRARSPAPPWTPPGSACRSPAPPWSPPGTPWSVCRSPAAELRASGAPPGAPARVRGARVSARCGMARVGVQLDWHHLVVSRVV
jgi:hypothetical protein